MANVFTGNPLILDTDFTNYRTAASVSEGIRVIKLMLVVGGSASVAGAITITNPQNSQVLYSVGVAAGVAANTVVLNDNPNGQAVLSWPNFGVTGLTATGTKLYLWFGY